MAIFGKKQKYPLAEVLRGIQYAVNSAQEMLQVQQLNNLNKFWSPESGEPISRKVKVGDKEIDVPLMALVPHSHLEMEDLEISFKTRIGDIAVLSENGIKDPGSQLLYTDLLMELESIRATDNDVVDIKIKFRHKEMSEGIARLADEYNKQL